MNLFDLAAILLTLAAVFGYLNNRFLRVEPSVGLMVAGLASSLGVILLDWFAPGLGVGNLVLGYLEGIDFNETLMHGMLGFLLFAGALHVDLEFFAQRKWSIGSLATVGLLLSTLLVAVMTKGLFFLLDMQASWLACLVFGALISPTDPIAVMGTLKTLNAPPSLEAKIAGEALFNDGVAVVVFTAIVAMLGAEAGNLGHASHAAGEGSDLEGVGLLFLRETGGGCLLGLVCGYVAYRLMRSIDDYKVEVLISIALVMGSYSLAWVWHLSGPLAVVLAGLLIGNQGRTLAMSEVTVDYLEKFWEMIDEILNAVLFLLIGLEVLAVAFNLTSFLTGLAVAGIVLFARLISVAVPISVLRLRKEFTPGAVRILTWAGLRGGISVALVLSLPPIPEKPLLISWTYVVVLFSILVQGLTLRKVLQRFI
jgi:CPA1 family monovalent cation:H+ antiporter